MRIPHAAIRGVAAIAALFAGATAGAPMASAHSHAKETDNVKHIRRSTHRRHKHRKAHGHHNGHRHSTVHRHGKGHGHGHGKGRGHRKIRCRIHIVVRHKPHRTECRVPTHTHHGVHSKRKRRHHPKHVTAPVPTAAPAPTPAPAPAPASAQPASLQPAGVSGSWRLAFDDEFNGSAINTSVWNEHDGWTNQNDVTDHAWNVAESGGVATLTLASSSSGATIATNQGVLAVGDFAEARVDFAGSGTTIYSWPAWWTSGPNWPAAGENDIAEGLGTLTVNYHSPSGAHNQGTVPGNWAGGFHTFGIYRGSNYCDVYWDGQLVKQYPTDDNGQPQDLLFTIGASNQLALGAAGEMEVDYVRVWAPA